MRAELIEDKSIPGQFRVEATDADGGCEVAIFCGPDALGRAIAFAAASGYYTEWADPQNWSDPERDAALFNGGSNASLVAPQSYFADVLDFHTKFLQPHIDTTPPQLMDGPMLDFRLKLINEELDEFVKAHAAGDLAAAADGLVDLTYVLLGTAACMGAPFDECWAAVHAANMAKVATPTDTPSRVKPTKPFGWQSPDIGKILRDRFYTHFNKDI